MAELVSTAQKAYTLRLPLRDDWIRKGGRGTPEWILEKVCDIQQ